MYLIYTVFTISNTVFQFLEKKKTFWLVYNTVPLGLEIRTLTQSKYENFTQNNLSSNLVGEKAL